MPKRPSAVEDPAREALTYGRRTCRISIGRNTYGHSNMRVRKGWLGCHLRIGAYCSLATEVEFIIRGNHRTDWVTTYPFGHVLTDKFGENRGNGHPASRSSVTVGNDVWIGRQAMILSGVTIGDGAVIGARAVIHRDVPDYTIVTGNPGVKLRDRFAPDIVARLKTLAWWTLPDEDVARIAPLLCEAPEAAVLDRLIEEFRPDAAHQHAD